MAMNIHFCDSTLLVDEICHPSLGGAPARLSVVSWLRQWSTLLHYFEYKYDRLYLIDSNRPSQKSLNLSTVLYFCFPSLRQSAQELSLARLFDFI